MKTIYKTLSLCSSLLLLFASCEKEDYGTFSLSTPVIESLAVTPLTFTCGDTLNLTATVSDPEVSISSLTVSITANNRLIATQAIPVTGSEVNAPVFVPLVDNLPDNADVKISLTATNLTKGVTSNEVSGLTAKRPYYEHLYLVTDDGDVYTLTPQAGNKDKYEASELTLRRSFRYRIAQKITADKQIDFSGFVWGDKNGTIQLVDENGDYLFAFSSGSDYTTSIVFDNYAFKIALEGNNYQANDLLLDNFEEVVTIDGETFNKTTRTLEKNQEITVFHELASMDVVFNLDFFERISVNKVKFLGETGDYTLYYNQTRKNVTVDVNNPSYPDYLLITGGGLGYPSKVEGIDKEHTWWGFDNIRQFILLRKVSDTIFQGTIFIHAKDDGWVGFKPYENTGWGGEKRFDAFTFTGENVLESSDGDNWHPTADIDTDAFYRLTINWGANTVNVQKVILP
jgi:hypothetical protein